MVYETRENIKYFHELWPGHRLILDPDQVASWKRYSGGGWAFDYEAESEHSHLKCLVDVDPNSKYHFYLNFQHSQSMRETVDSLPSRIHVPRTGTNTFQIPLYDLQPTLELLTAHRNYDVVITNAVFDLYEGVIKEDELIKSLAEITEDDMAEIAKIKAVYEQSTMINHDKITPFKFQYAGVAMMLHIYGVADKLVPGFVMERKELRPISTLTSKKDDEPQLSLLIDEYIKS